MASSPIDAHVRLDTHPVHASAVTATITGSQAHIPRLALEDGNWTVVDKNVLVLARIDHEEPYWANEAAQHLEADGVTVEITPQLRKAIYEEWTWASYPMPWLTRSEIREVSDEAQKTHDDIQHGRLLVHAHAHDGHTTVAVATYIGSGKSVHLHGEDHLRQVSGTFDSPAQALLAFEKLHGATMRPGPAPATDTERTAAEARSTPLPAHAEPVRIEPETVPAYAADAGDHDALLDTFLDAHRDWQKWRTWSDETTHAIHESQTLRIERIHEADARETAWTVAAYETPVSDRMWVLTATGSTPAPVLKELLDHLADPDDWNTTLGSPVSEKTVTTATQPLTDAGWKHTMDGPWIRWSSPAGDAGVQFDALAAQRANQNLNTWTVWAGPDPDRATWTITASPYTPRALLAALSENLAHATGIRSAQTPSHERKRTLGAVPPPVPVAAASRTR
ncbi:DUF317 domain-containing protein [Streptomyces sp. SID8366]|uniref:DUF317 domain-containing protein n=1 Tax=unclassified Streptomyces TaxID=2593676 RepID=UPI000DBA29A8|nr:DUF317 domain-containing protein [Streptomyces sp. PsTaAH-130]MYU06167.1 DUF317 domain-containing protein [Streptomyces sp. SID8366]MYU61741.1 DUF317 domain-containing protein [Streptomyces sp. SID69]RAJ64240.1 uncharacterized protein DUF317 [Streptomyces sp. PsTaAH-130]